MHVIKKDFYKAPAKIWANDVEANTLSQIDNVCSLPFLAGPTCFMADTHFGFGVPIGSVIVTKDVIFNIYMLMLFSYLFLIIYLIFFTFQLDLFLYII